MKRNYNVTLEAVKELYKAYKFVLIPIVMIGVSILLFFFVIIPQIKDVLKAQSDKDAYLKKIAILQQNVQTLSDVDDAVLSNQLSTAVSALPPQKDFIGILTAIATAASITNVSIGDYTFQVGSIGGEGVADVAKSPTIAFNVIVTGSLSDAQRFTHILSQILPLSQATSLTTNNTSSTVKLSFFYKPFPPLRADDYQPIKTLSTREQDTISQISSWNKSISQ